MYHTKIPNTDIEVSTLGLGTVKLGRNNGVKYPKSFNIPSDQQVIDILNTAAECGINLIDTAPAYGNSEQRLGEILPKTPHNWLISTKVGEIFNPNTGESSYDFTPEHIQQSVENSLRYLNKEQLDIVLVHSNGDDVNIIKQGALDTLQSLKNKGLIRAIGMSTKTVEGGIMALKHSDIAMVTHNLQHQDEVDVIKYAHDAGKGIFIKKALSSGHIATHKSNNIIADSFYSILKNPGVSSIILGSINPAHIQKNAEDLDIAMKKLQNL